MTTGGFDPNQGQFTQQQFARPQGPGHLPGQLAPRFGARLVDGLIIGIPTAIVSTVLTYLIGFPGGILGGLVTVAAALGYFVYLETTKGQTFGKKLVNLRVVGPDGGLPTQKQSLIRNAFYGFSALGSIPLIGLPFSLVGIVLMIVIAVTISQNPLRQGKHDELAGGTRVVQV